MPVIKVKDDEEDASGAFETKRDRMATETLEEETVETTSEPQETHAESIEETESPVETQARQKGWRPKEEFEGDSEEWVPAEEFVARGPLYETIHKLNRKVKRMQDSLDAAGQQYSKMEKRVREETIASLKKELNEASANNDVAKAMEVKDRIVEVEKEAKTDSPPSNPAFDSWVEDNQWYNDDDVLRAAADGLGYSLKQKNPDMPATDLYAEVTKRIKQKFPQEFKSESKVTTVTTASKRPTANAVTKKKTNLPAYRQLPADAKINYRRLVKSDRNPHGVITHEQFMKDYVANGGPLDTEE